ncbi:unnamed protein product [Brassicogethes aeneus]|uniref:Sec16 Sec23-binding domain-containing protein n=1 Tax=Brassicogethes aeneus TaxID=1431903 RepID=A0A9P0BBS3_BRAAE|nr:unnamed protein product [Brassicogethes aeneus]
MSWVNKRRGQSVPNPATAPQVQMYNPNQHSTNMQENQWQQNNWYGQQQQQQPNQQHLQQQQQQLQQQQYQHKQETDQPSYWQQPPNSAYNQNAQYGNYADQSGYYQNTEGYQQPPQQQQAYGNVQYNQQQYSQNNAYQQPGAEGTDAWNWGWGDEDNSNNVAAVKHEAAAAADNAATSDASWSWPAADDSRAADGVRPDNDSFARADVKQPPFKADGDRLEVVKRGKLDTPQWSVESQMSLESSDDVGMVSRGSTVSHSPVSGQEVLPGQNVEIPFENKEILPSVKQEAAEVTPPTKANPTPPPPINNPTPPLYPASSSEDLKNPYKRSSKLTPLTNAFHAQTVNLETPPDNSEQPDTVPDRAPAKADQGRPASGAPPWPENQETPMNDRNQYLETGQLSEFAAPAAADAPSDPADALPPPGLRRMVLGQMEQNEGAANEPPPGLSRMVLGQTESNPDAAGVSEPPEGLRRMIPGEPSSPEARRQEVDSEPEFDRLASLTPQQRSATIGADTPPADAAAGSNASRPERKPDKDVSSMINSVRNLTVGENTDDDDSVKGSGAREDSSDSAEADASKKRDGKRYHHDKNKYRDRYTPEKSDKKYDKRRYNRERRYDDDTEDYFSDRDRDRDRDPRRDHRNYESKKYGSLRNKDKDRRRRDPRDTRDPRDPRDPREPRSYRGDPRRNDYYGYNRYEDDYAENSRPTSRSDSMHESFKDRADPRHRHKERDPYRKPRDGRDFYNPYPGYDPFNPYYQQYQYYENLRRTNPQAYAEWYRKYYQQATGNASSSFGGDDRASVHSGRSSANEDLNKDSLNRPFDHTDSSTTNLENRSASAHRMTPAKFATAHAKASIASGKLLRVLPNYPLDGQPALVEVCSLQLALQNDEEFRELDSFPGPLVRGVTHKKTIIEYCESKIKGAAFGGDAVPDVDSYVLMWELLILLIRQNGMVVGTDIAELLLKENKSREGLVRPSSVLSSISSAAGDNNLHSEASNQPNSEAISGSMQSVMKEEEITLKFREYLLYGSCKEALEWAMKHGLWGHALFLASKLDKRTYANVMMRFANGLTMNDPLQTLYQLLSGRMPAAVTCVSEEKWGDWRPHLAMILSNSNHRPELNCKAITLLGDTLSHRGALYAAQFCYLMSDVGFGGRDDPEARVTLLGADRRAKDLARFATNEAVHMTEIYEYACSLNDPQFVIPEFQVYKYLVATRLADRGLPEKSLSYLEKLSEYVVKNPSTVSGKLVDAVCDLADRLKYSDPVGDDDDVDESQFGVRSQETSRPDQTWLKDLRAVQSEFHAGLITQAAAIVYSEPPVEESSLQQASYDSGAQETWQQHYQQQQQQQQWQPETTPVENQQSFTQPPENDVSNANQYQQPQPDQQRYWQNQSQQWNDAQQSQFSQDSADQQQTYYANNTTEDVARQPQISMPNQSGRRRSDGEDEPSASAAAGERQGSSPVRSGKTASPEKSTSTGWFGGIFSKITLKPKNQMKLPDDKNPKIVWDQDKKRWVNVDDDGNETANEVKPPPKMADMMPKMAPPAGAPHPLQQPVPTFDVNGAVSNYSHLSSEAASRPQMPEPSAADSLPPNPAAAAAGGNMFKMKGRGRNLKKSYVDVFNPGGKPAGGPTTLPDQQQQQQKMPPMNFFTPQPINDPNASIDFLTPAPPLHFDATQMSRWSSASSLSKEVEFYMKQKPQPR